MTQFAKGIGFEQKEPTIFYEDNKTVIMTAENEYPVAGRMKHVDVKFRFVQESVKMGEIRIRYMSTELNWTDVLTKTLVPKKHTSTSWVMSDPFSFLSITALLWIAGIWSQHFHPCFLNFRCLW